MDFLEFIIKFLPDIFYLAKIGGIIGIIVGGLISLYIISENKNKDKNKTIENSEEDNEID